MHQIKFLKAWLAWRDARDAYLYLSSSRSPGDLQNWRIYWAACVTLLRAVGHVLDKADAEESDIAKTVISGWWSLLKKSQEWIFWKFIEDSRNNLIKTYELSVEVWPVTTKPHWAEHHTYEQLVEIYGEQKKLMTAEGRDAVELLAQAIEWWDLNLRAIEEAILCNVTVPLHLGDKEFKRLVDQNFLRERALIHSQENARQAMLEKGSPW